MDEIPKKGPDPRPSAPDSKWIYRIVIAVVLGEAIWSFLASLTNNLLLPAIASLVGGAQFDFKVSNIVASIIELCLAGVVAVVLNSWSRKALRADRKPGNRASVVTPAPAPATAAAAIVPSAAPTSSAMATAATSAAAPAASGAPAPAPSPVPPPAKPPKPTHEKQIYYNIVGERVDADDE
jgi:hypothetical protein